MFALWNWVWLEESSRASSPGNSSNCCSSPELTSETPSVVATSSESDCNSIPEITHTVIFKCISESITKT